jgi:hypothetical protein
MSNAVEHYRGSTAAAIPDSHEWAHIERVAKMMAASLLCPRAFKDKPEDLMVVALSLRDTDIPFTLNTLNQCYVIEGRMEMMAQLKVAIAARHGWDIWFEPGECNDLQAVVHYKAPGKPERSMVYTIDEARSAHLLDEWVETWVPTGEKWPETGKPKNRKVKVTVAVDGVLVPEADMPEWARKAKNSGPWQRKEPWFASRGAMLMARAITKALRYAAPHLTLGIGDMEMDPAPVNEEADAVPPRLVDAETGEITAPSNGAAERQPIERQVPPRSVAPTGASIPEALREPAIDEDERARLIGVLDGLAPEVVERVREKAQELAIPNLRSNRVTKAHGALVWMLIEHAKQPSPWDESPAPDLPASGPIDISVDPPVEHLTPEVVQPRLADQVDPDGVFADPGDLGDSQTVPYADGEEPF